jgi:hypothetical protein
MYRALTGKFDIFDRHINADDPEQTIRALPTYIPRGKPTEWYRQQADAYQQKADHAHDMAELLRDMQRKTAFERLSREEKLDKLRERAERIARHKALIAEWEAKVPAYEAELARKEVVYEGLAPIERMVREWMDRQSNPQAIVDTLRECLPDAEEEQQWMLEHLR